uniref:Uncharacterized protein n=1 Tax=Arundo donax TaxID=35708 RepID=A0A0A8ZVW4_ARUDO
MWIPSCVQKAGRKRAPGDQVHGSFDRLATDLADGIIHAILLQQIVLV